MQNSVITVNYNYKNQPYKKQQFAIYDLTYNM